VSAESAIILLQGLIFIGAAAVWGVIAVGLFADNPEPLDTTSGRSGLFKGKSPSRVIGQISFHELISIWQFIVSYGYFQMFPLIKPKLPKISY
jgi:ammonia channel protein AmtB